MKLTFFLIPFVPSFPWTSYRTCDLQLIFFIWLMLELFTDPRVFFNHLNRDVCLCACSDLWKLFLLWFPASACLILHCILLFLSFFLILMKSKREKKTRGLVYESINSPNMRISSKYTIKNFTGDWVFICVWRMKPLCCLLWPLC